MDNKNNFIIIFLPFLAVNFILTMYFLFDQNL